MKCCVPLCEEDSVLHKFPTANEKQRRVWLERIGDAELIRKEQEVLQQYYGVCDLHFEQSCHASDSLELIPGALPTLHLPGSRSDKYVGRNAMDFLPDHSESPEALDMIVEGISDSTYVENLRVEYEVEVEDVAKRYSSDRTERVRHESEITIHRPKDIEIVTRYAMKCEQESDDEIILKYPNDDDVIKRYSAGAGHSSIGRRVGVCDKGSSTDDSILEECANRFPETNLSPNIPVAVDGVPSSVDQSDASDSGVRSLMHEPISPIRTQPSSIRNESNSEMSESNEDSMSGQEVSEHPSDDDEEEGIRRDPGELNSASEEFEDSCYDSVDADEALRALMKPSCSSPRNPSITVYNLCCDKKFLSSISIDSPKKDSLPTRGTTRHRDFLHDLVMNAPLSNSFQGVGDSKRNPFTGKKSRNKNKSKARNDNLLSVIHSLEKIAQNVETQCIEARRSLRKNCSHSNILRTGAKLKGEVSPLLNSQLSLIKKIRTNVP